MRRSLIAGECVVLAVFFALFVSGAAFNMAGLNYSTETAGGGLKVHPYTVLTVIAFLVVVCGAHSLKHAVNSSRFRVAVAGAWVTCAILVMKSLQSAGQSLGFAVDTIVAAFLLAAVLPFTTQRVARRLSRMITLFIVIESVLAMLEVVAHVNLITIGDWYGEYFRSTALQGHPLNNALILVTLSVCQQTCVRRLTSVLIFVLTVGALIAFGARGALAIYLLVNAVTFARYGLASAGRLAVFMAGATACAGGVAWLLLSGVVGTRISQVGAYDDSAAVRVKSVDLLQQLDWWRLLAGNSTIDITRMMSNAGIGVIENFLVGYVLAFGAVCTVAIGYFVYATGRKLTYDAASAMRTRFLVILLVFFAVALTNNSLITKTPAFFLLIVGIWCTRCRWLERIESVSAATASEQARHIPDGVAASVDERLQAGASLRRRRA
ncbi:hypothetical protein G3A43_41675 [Paraburkholderia aspalathi]|uniref:VpsF family polysaccharide biosynthesis protein n=1 Tax=Paraburkholderia nemoris TaxID=2793076 RepID=UPI00190E23B1|nr:MULTISPECIES: VpsF family polysaccharide biosynthesis protein [Paraburkholderia]MBK3786698.1 hypothetical protein [Paraburkholderia aspalathi]